MWQRMLFLNGHKLKQFLSVAFYGEMSLENCVMSLAISLYFTISCMLNSVFSIMIYQDTLTMDGVLF